MVKVEPPCPYFGTCGGCTLQDLAYTDQLQLKRDRVTQALAPFDVTSPIDIIPLNDPWRYRNKAELTFSEADGHLILGYHVSKSFWRIVNLEDCLLLPEPAMQLVRDVRDLAAASGLPVYQTRTHQGFFRYLLVRSSQTIGHLMICLVTTGVFNGEEETVQRTIKQIASELMARNPALVSVFWGQTDSLADVATPQRLILVHGTEHLEEQIGPFRIRVHPFSFLQASSHAADRLYRYVSDCLSGMTNGVAWDLYCGLGLVGLYLSRQMRKVYSIESEPSQVELATLNALRNGIQNIEFHTGCVEMLLRERRFWLQEAKPDVIVVDPPRAGLHLSALTSLLAARPAVLVYISCNVDSLTRDLRVLHTSFPRYRVREVRAFDLFAQTNHVEVCVVLERCARVGSGSG